MHAGQRFPGSRFIIVIAIVYMLLPSDKAGAQSLITTLKQQVRTGTFRDSASQSRSVSIPAKPAKSAKIRDAANRGDATRGWNVKGGGSMTREALYARCRNAIFAKYGWKGYDGKRYLYPSFSLQRTDQCVASGGVVQ
jgi:hypothetical protein